MWEVWNVLAGGNVAKLWAYSMRSTLMPSASYMAWTDSKSTPTKRRCNFSLAKLMQSCSSELTSKTSKPKMSTYAMCGPTPPP